MMEVEHIKCSRCRSYRPKHKFLNDTGRLLLTCIKCRTTTLNQYYNKIKKNKAYLPLEEHIENRNNIMNEEKEPFTNDFKETPKKRITVIEMMEIINNVGVKHMKPEDFADGYNREFFT